MVNPNWHPATLRAYTRAMTRRNLERLSTFQRERAMRGYDPTDVQSLNTGKLKIILAIALAYLAYRGYKKYRRYRKKSKV